MWLIAKMAAVGNLPFKLAAGSYTVGRSLNCEIVIPDRSVSRIHARLTCVSSRTAYLEDLSSTNGTFVNGSRVEHSRLSPPCSIEFGSVSVELARKAPFPDSPPSASKGATERASDLVTKQLSAQRLTRTQLRVLSLLLKGWEEKRIAARLKQSVHTTHNHVRAIYQSFRVHSRPQLMARFLRSR